MSNYQPDIRPKSTDPNCETGVIKLLPRKYIHILDKTSGVTRLETGAQRLVLTDNEETVGKIENFIVIPPQNYVRIDNPVIKVDGVPQTDPDGQVKVRLGDSEIRLAQDPFPLYPGEVAGPVTPLTIVLPDTALHLVAERDFTEKEAEGEGENAKPAVVRHAGDEWLFYGPATYVPRVEVKVAPTVTPTTVLPNEALLIEAKRAFTDRNGVARNKGEKWLVRELGAYLPDVNEHVAEPRKAEILTETTALHLKALRTFKDVYGKDRKAGEEWLITLDDAETHILDVFEEKVKTVTATTLTDRQFAVILNPVGEDGKPQYGHREVKIGRTSFFLHPGEQLEGGKVKDVYVLRENEALLLEAVNAFADGEDARKPGDRWLKKGPADYVPNVNVKVVETRYAIPLDKNQGKYVRNTKTGVIRTVRGPQTYMLEAYEELWEKELSPTVEELLANQLDPTADRGVYLKEPKKPVYDERNLRGDQTMRSLSYDDRSREIDPVALAMPRKQRDKTDAITFRVPPNAAVQIFDYKEDKRRIEFGPKFEMLNPDEELTVLSLSGGKPKVANKIKSLVLLLGPDYMTEKFQVETSDHTKLDVLLSANWVFEVDRENPEKLFSVPDFVGDAVKAIASRVRGAVAATPFDEFHKNSAKIIRSAVFGLDSDGHVNPKFIFEDNGLAITNIDIKEIEPVDEATKASLARANSLAIKITTDALEANAERESERLKQEAQSKLDLQKIQSQTAAAEKQKALNTALAEAEAIKQTGATTAAAKANAEAAALTAKAELDLANTRAESRRITAENDLALEKQRGEQDIELAKQRNALEEEHAGKMASINTEATTKLIETLTPAALIAIAKAGPELQVELMQALGEKSLIFTDGKTPISLLSAANAILPIGGGSATPVLPGTQLAPTGATVVPASR